MTSGDGDSSSWDDLSRQLPPPPPPSLPPPSESGDIGSWDDFLHELPPSPPLGGGEIFDGEMVPSSLVEIACILRAANEVELSNPRVAYLCRSYAFEKSQVLDPTSSGQGVSQFKTALLHRLQREDDQTLTGRMKKSDAHEMQSFYRHYYAKYIKALELDSAADRPQFTKAYQSYKTAVVLFDVLNAVKRKHAMEVDREVEVAQACKPVVKKAGLRESVRTVAHLLFGQAFNKVLQIYRNFNGHRNDSSARNNA